MSSVLITGGSGFLGRHLVQEMLRRNLYRRICIYSRGEHAQAKMREECSDDRLRWFIGDVRDLPRLTRAMEGCDDVIHAAALKRIELAQYCPDELIKTNCIGSMNVVEAAARAAVLRCLLVSTDKAYAPRSAYGYTKASAEALFLTANNLYPRGPCYAVVRYGNVWRSTGSVVSVWEKQIQRGEKITVTDPYCTRFFMTIEQAVQLVLDTLKDMKGGELAVPDLPAYQLQDLARAMGQRQYKVVGLPEWEKLHENMSDEQCSVTVRRMSIEELEDALEHR